MVKQRSVICECGNDIYESDYVRPVDAPEGTEWRNVWRCSNCFRETPRKRVQRRTNRSRAIDAYLSVHDQWQATDDALTALVTTGAVAGGALLVHSSTFNYHLNQLSSLDAPTNFQVRYHTAQAREELVKAKGFVAEKLALTNA